MIYFSNNFVMVEWLRWATPVACVYEEDISKTIVASYGKESASSVAYLGKWKSNLYMQ